MKKLLILSLLCGSASAYETYIEPTQPGTTLKDYSRPGMVVDGNRAYQTISGTTLQDFSRPGLIRDGNNVYQTIPGTTLKDWNAPGYQIKRY